MKAAALLVCAAAAAPASAQIADYEVVDDAIPAPLTDVAGDPAAGRAAFLDRGRGHCLLCHQVSGLDAPFQGTLGPDLSDYGERMEEGTTRLRLVDGTRLNPDTIMPAYHRTDGLREVQAPYRGRPVLTAQEIEDVIAYLRSLR